MATERSSTPPLQTAPSNPGVLPKSPLTPEQIRKIEINRLKAKALRAQKEAAAKTTSTTTPPSNLAAGQKRAHSSISTSNVPSTLRDGRSNNAGSSNPPSFRPLDSIQPARNFTKYVEYDFSKMTDTKGGFLTLADDPHNKALHAPSSTDEKPAHMTLREWERHQLLKTLREQKAGPFEPNLSVLTKDSTAAENKCRECDTIDIDWKWAEVFHLAVCNACKDKFPDKYSLLTKTEARSDYLLTDPELQDGELLPHLERPNPHKATWNNMMLYLRCQVEEYAFGRKWGSAEKLDEAFEAREEGKKRRRQDRFRQKLTELKKKTRVEAWRRGRKGEAGGEFGDVLRRPGKHEHVWGRAVGGEGEDGVGVKTCVDCGMEVEELEF